VSTGYITKRMLSRSSCCLILDTYTTVSPGVFCLRMHWHSMLGSLATPNSR
jgi:hypothetical protein